MKRTTTGPRGLDLLITPGPAQPRYRGEPRLRWIVERVTAAGALRLAAAVDLECEDAAREMFDANVAACGGDSAEPSIHGVIGVRLALILTDDTGWEHDREPVDEWKAGDR